MDASSTKSLTGDDPHESIPSRTNLPGIVASWILYQHEDEFAGHSVSENTLRGFPTLYVHGTILRNVCS